MSANCLFLALEAADWEQLKNAPETQLDVPGSPLLYEEGTGGGAVFRGLVLQDDVAQVLEFLLDPGRRPPLGPEAPFVVSWASPAPIEDAVGQATPLDNSAWHLSPEDVAKAARGLEGIRWETLTSRYDPGLLRESGFGRMSEQQDSLHSWSLEDLPVLQDAWRELVAYFQQAARQHHHMLLLQEDGPMSSLDLELE